MVVISQNEVQQRSTPTRYSPSIWIFRIRRYAPAQDQRLAHRFLKDGVPLALVETALLLASLRRLCRPAGVPPLPRIRSLAYFHPVIEELQQHPVPDGYRDYLRVKLRAAMDTNEPAKVQKSTFSDDR